MSSLRPAVHVVVAYEDSASARRAQSFCRALGDFVGQNRALRCSFWKIDLLAVRGLRALATEDAVTADVLVLALESVFELAPDVAQWAAQPPLASVSRAGQLLVLMGPESGGLSAEPFLSADLRAIAVQSGRRLCWRAWEMADEDAALAQDLAQELTTPDVLVVSSQAGWAPLPG